MTLTNKSLFGQLLELIQRNVFDALIAKHRAHRHTKGFSCYTQLVAMLYCHLGRADSLREICCGLRSFRRKLCHLGLKSIPARSTLSYANIHRPAELFADLFFMLLDQLRGQSGIMPRKHRFQFDNPLLSLDATIISLSLKLFPWADYNRTKGGIKVHVVLDHADYLPRFVRITEVQQHDIRYARTLNLPPGSVVAMDRAYLDFRLLSAWNAQGVFFVTPHKDGLVYRVIQGNPVPSGSQIVSDELIALGARVSKRRYKPLLRRIQLTVVDERGQSRELALLTNQLEFSAELLAEIYKERWQIELFFKALKQNLTLRHFVGTSENALKIQIWTALLALLLLKWLHYRSRCRWSLSNLASTLRLNLFTYRDLQQFLDEPWDPPPEPEFIRQMVLTF